LPRNLLSGKPFTDKGRNLKRQDEPEKLKDTAFGFQIKMP
jgi:hypothetical protein